MAMTQEEISVVVLRLKADVSEMQVALGGMQSASATASSKVASNMKQIALGFGVVAAAAGLAFAGVNRLMRGIEGLANEYKKQEQAERKLANNLGYTSTLLIKQAAALQKVTKFGDEATLEAQSLIAGFIKEEDAIARLIPVVQDLAEAKGMSLASAADLVTKSITSGSNALSRYGITISNTTDKSKRMNEIIEQIEKAYGGVARAVAATDTGKLDVLNNRLSDIREELGKRLLPVLTTWKSAWAEAGETAVKSIDSISHPIETLKKSWIGTLGTMLGLGPSLAEKRAAFKPTPAAGGGKPPPTTPAEAPEVKLARSSAAAAQAIERLKGQTAALDRDREAGRVSMEQYYAQRIALAEQQAALEIGLIQKQLKGEADLSKQIDDQGKIRVKQVALENEIAALRGEQSADEQVAQQARITNALRVYTAEVQTALSILEDEYRSGKVSLDKYYARKEELIRLQADEEIATLETLSSSTGDQQVKLDTLVQVKERELQLDRELSTLRKDELSDRNKLAETERVEAERRVAKIEKDKQNAEKARKEQLDQINKAASDISSVVGALASVYEEYYNYVVEEEQRKMDASIASAQATGASEQQLAALRTGLEAQANARAKKAWEKQKKAQIAMAVINAAQAVIKGYSDYGPIVGTIFAVLTAVATGIQIARMASQEYPGMAEGGMVDRGSTATADDVHARLSRGEYVTPAKSVDYYGPQVMEAMRRREVPRELFSGIGAARVRAPASMRFAEGGLVNPVQASQAQGAPVIVNLLDASVLDRYLGSIEGQRAVVNIISRRSYEVQKALGVNT